MYSIPISIGRYTDPGPRSINEDAHFAVTFPADHASEVIAILGIADGMGGLKKGQEASFSVLDTFQRKITEQVYGLPPLISKGERLVLLKAGIEEDFREANEEILRFKSETGSMRAPLGSTMTVAVVMRSTLLLGHVGDSRATFVSSGGRIEQLTEDHAVGKKLVNRLGIEGMHVQIVSRRIDDGQALVLCTDGVLDVLSPEEMARVVLTTPSIQEACNELVFKAKAKGTADNATALALEYGRLKRMPAERPKTAAKSTVRRQTNRNRPSSARQAARAADLRTKTEAKTPAWRKTAYGAAAFLLLVTTFFGWLTLKQYRAQRANPESVTTGSEKRGVITAGIPSGGEGPPVSKRTSQLTDQNKPDPDESVSPSATETPGATARVKERDSTKARPTSRVTGNAGEHITTGPGFIFQILDRDSFFPDGVDLAVVGSIKIKFYPRVPAGLKLEFFLDEKKIQKDIGFSVLRDEERTIEVPLDILKRQLTPGRQALLEIGIVGSGLAKQPLYIWTSRTSVPLTPRNPEKDDLITFFKNSLGFGDLPDLEPDTRISIHYDPGSLAALKKIAPQASVVFGVTVRKPSGESNPLLEKPLAEGGGGETSSFTFRDTNLPQGEYFLEASADFGEPVSKILSDFRSVFYLGCIKAIRPPEEFSQANSEFFFQWEPFGDISRKLYILSVAKSVGLLKMTDSGPGHVHKIPKHLNADHFDIGSIENFIEENEKEPSGVWYWQIKCQIRYRGRSLWVSSPVRSIRLTK